MSDETFEIQPKKPLFKKWWFWVIIIAVVLTAAGWKVLTKKSDSGKSIIGEVIKSTNKYPSCPANLNGILTHELIDMTKVSSMLPLGNISPAGHTSPVDHVYFNTKTADKIALYAPADSWITNIIKVSQDTDGSGYNHNTYVVQFTVCDGLILDYAGYTELSQTLTDVVSQKSDKCKGDIVKEGHKGKQQQCNFDLNEQVKSGDLIGYTQATLEDGNYNLPFEIWTANYNVPVPSNIDWTYYNDDRYAHIMCPFDLYTGDLKQTFYSKLGGEQNEAAFDEKTGKKLESKITVFKQRTIEPICGTVNQNIVGTIQGMWFGEGWKEKHQQDFVDDSRQFSFLHNNVDPTLAEIGNAGEITSGTSGQLQFEPKHSGKIDREPSEVKADGQTYCYNFSVSKNGQSANPGRILAQLVDDRHLKLEYQSGACTGSEAFSKPYNYER